MSGFAKRSGGMLIPYGVHFCTRSLTPAPASAGDEVTLYLHRECECGGGHRRPSEAIRGHQRPSEAIRGHRRPSEAIERHQRPSEAIRGDQRPRSIARDESSSRSKQRDLGCFEQPNRFTKLSGL